MNTKYAIGPSTTLSEFSYGPFMNLQGCLGIVPWDTLQAAGKPIFIYEIASTKPYKRLYRWHRGRGEWIKL